MKIFKSIKSIIVLMLSILIFIIGIILYNVYDNNRIVLVKEEVEIKNLPTSFNNFKILQLADLHGKMFGENQKNLIDKINNIDYDVIAITGDMIDNDSDDYKPLIELLEGIENKEYIFYVPGNHGPEFFDKLGDLGCIPLDKPYEIKRGNDKIVVFDFYDNLEFRDNIKEYESYTTIGITHYPWNNSFYDNAREHVGKYDLVIAGHYHGGQIRIPFYGALFIPNINDAEFFPKQSDVSGYNVYGDYKQYVSRGLGAGKLGSTNLKFRLFNTPEINLITLVKNK